MAEQRGLSRQNSYQEALDSIEGDFDLSFATGLSEEEVREHLPFLQAIEDTIPTILSVLEAVQAVVDFVTEVLEFLANIIGLAVDLFEAVIEAGEKNNIVCPRILENNFEGKLQVFLLEFL